MSQSGVTGELTPNQVNQTLLTETRSADHVRLRALAHDGLPLGSGPSWHAAWRNGKCIETWLARSAIHFADRCDRNQPSAGSRPAARASERSAWSPNRFQSSRRPPCS